LHFFLFYLFAAELEVPELYQLKKEEEEEMDDDDATSKSDSLLFDEASIASERSLAFNELQDLPDSSDANH